MRDLILIVSLAAIGIVLLFLIPLERGITYVVVRSLGFGLLVGAFAAWARLIQKLRAKSKPIDLP
jgi:hypothetical protein